jgi:hypothetical protein
MCDGAGVMAVLGVGVPSFPSTGWNQPRCIGVSVWGAVGVCVGVLVATTFDTAAVANNDGVGNFSCLASRPRLVPAGDCILETDLRIDERPFRNLGSSLDFCKLAMSLLVSC